MDIDTTSYNLQKNNPYSPPISYTAGKQKKSFAYCNWKSNQRSNLPKGGDMRVLKIGFQSDDLYPCLNTDIWYC